MSYKDKTRAWDPAEHIDVDDPDYIREYLSVMLEENGSEGFLRALGHVAKAKGMSEIARQAEVGRESLYKSLSETGKPRFDTINKVIESLGLQLTIKTT